MTQSPITLTINNTATSSQQLMLIETMLICVGIIHNPSNSITTVSRHSFIYGDLTTWFFYGCQCVCVCSYILCCYRNRRVDHFQLEFNSTVVGINGLWQSFISPVPQLTDSTCGSRCKVKLRVEIKPGVLIPPLRGKRPRKARGCVTSPWDWEMKQSESGSILSSFAL